MKAFWTQCALVFALALGSLAPTQARAANLTGIMVFSCDADGNPAGDFIWDTRGLDSDFYKVWLTSGPVGGTQKGRTAPFINGPDWEHAPIDISLVNGMNRFSLFFEYNGHWSTFAINLFFDDNTVPAISVKAPLRTGGVAPEFTVNNAPSTFSLTSYPAPNAPAAGTSSVRLDKFISLEAFSVASPAEFTLDRVDTHAVGASGRYDYVGTFTLKVTPRR